MSEHKEHGERGERSEPIEHGEPSARAPGDAGLPDLSHGC